MSEHIYLKWLSSKTKSIYWHDSTVRAEQLEAFSNGAVGMTTNPFLIQSTLNNERSFWEERFSKLPKGLKGDEKARNLTHIVAGFFAEQLFPIFELDIAGKGYVCAQTNPNKTGDAEYMIEQAKTFASWAPNIVVKVPATNAGIKAYEECIAMGLNMAATVSFTVPQVLCVGEAAARGKKRAIENGIKPGLTIAVLMVGRLDDYLRDVAHDSGANVQESDIIQAGIACMKKAYRIFNERGYDTFLMPAGCRGANQVIELAGAKMIFSIAPKIVKMLPGNTPCEERIDIPVEQDVIDRLMTMPEFRKAYEEDGMTREQFITFGSTNRTIDQFINDGWNLLLSFRYESGKHERMNYFEWINSCTPTAWWHDSGNPDEIDLAIRRGATGVTTNPVLTFRSFQSQADFWKPKVLALGDDFEPEARAEALLKLVATYAAEKVWPVYERTNGADGYALGQLNPNRAGDAEGMLAQARRVHSWAPNIAVKLPATAAGIEVIEHLAEEGIPICATINVSVSQAIAVAEAYKCGKQKAVAAGVKPPLCIVVQQVGRLDDYLRDIAQDMKLGLDDEVITRAGLAVAKRTYHIFEKRGYDCIIMPAGLRGAYHLTEMAGGRLLYTINTRVQNMILEADPPKIEKIHDPVEPKILEQLMRIPEFVRAYEPDGMKPQEFITYGVTQKLLSQFNESGWTPLETYLSNLKSMRWI